MKRTETEVADAVLNRMLADGWDCYPEVMMPFGGRADIVGVRPFPFMPQRQCVAVVECKTSWTLSLLEQAEQRISFAHYVSIAAPTASSFFFERVCRERGVGMIRFTRSADLTIDEHRSLEPRRFVHKHRARFNRTGPQRLLETLDDDMKRYAPGTTAAAGYSTPWRRTMQRAAQYVADHPGCTVKEIVSRVDTHYAGVGSAKQGLLRWLETWDGIEARRDGRSIRFYPVRNPGVETEAP